MSQKIIIAGGGTGGHIFPALAIAKALQRLDAGTEILFVGANHKMEMTKVPAAGYAIKGLDIAGFNRRALWKNISLPFKLIKSFFQVRSIFKSYQPTATIGVGGYSTYPVLKYAQTKNIPSYIFEVNSLPGKSNQMLSKGATLIFSASDNMEKFFPPSKTIICGNPVRKEIAENVISRREAGAFFGLNEAKLTLLVLGGSLGAKSINESIANSLAALESLGIQLIWQTGKATADTFLKVAANKKNVKAFEFLDRMDMAYAAADIIVSRSGGTVHELCLVGKPAILVPYPFATDDHQTANAMNLVNSDAAIIIKDNEVMEQLLPTVEKLTKDEDMRKRLSANIAKLAKRDADLIVAKKILENLSSK